MRNFIMAMAVFFCVFAAPAQAEETPDVTRWTVVSEKSPRCFRSLSSPAIGWSTWAAN